MMMRIIDEQLPDLQTVHIGVVGLGYVGLPLAVAFGRLRHTVGFDIKPQRISSLQKYCDTTQELSTTDLQAAEKLQFTCQPSDLAICNVWIVAVPTPIDAYKKPDLRPLLAATKTVGQMLKAGCVVIFESTVYPGATEEICVPELERVSGLVFNQDFFVGYSPERMNPGDPLRRVETITKITSGSTSKAAKFVDQLYQLVVTAGTHSVPRICEAEAAKVIENTQRDVNIALINELAILFNRLQIDTETVLRAAGTKWNFLPFQPGLVGGHCIGVDPYYLTHKAQQVGYHPEMILAGRRINDAMGAYVAQQVMKCMLKKRIHIAQSRILILGLTFKENCTDLRNSKVFDIVQELRSYYATVDLHDPWVCAETLMEEHELLLTTTIQENFYDAIILTVKHDCFKDFSLEQVRTWGKENVVLYDVKHLWPRDQVDGRL